MNKRLAAIATLVAAVAAAAGLFASPSKSAEQPPNCEPLGCVVALTGTGPSPSTLTMHAEGQVRFYNPDSVTHTVVFANGLCSLTVTPGEFPPACNDRFESFVGRYSYTVDGKFTGTVITTPLRRSVTLTARTHTIRGGTRLTLHGRVMWSGWGSAPAAVVVLARHNSNQPFEPIATVRARFQRVVRNYPDVHTTYGWKLNAQPDVTTTYIARVTTQRLCYGPASRCAHPHGQVWTNAKSRLFTVRIRQ